MNLQGRGSGSGQEPSDLRHHHRGIGHVVRPHVAKHSVPEALERAIALAIASSCATTGEVIPAVELDIEQVIRPREIELDRSPSGNPHQMVQDRPGDPGSLQIPNRQAFEVGIGDGLGEGRQGRPEGGDPRSAASFVGLETLDQSPNREREMPATGIDSAQYTLDGLPGRGVEQRAAPRRRRVCRPPDPASRGGGRRCGGRGRPPGGSGMTSPPRCPARGAGAFRDTRARGPSHQWQGPPLRPRARDR